MFAAEDSPGHAARAPAPESSAARLEIFVNWLDDTVSLYLGERGRLEMWPGRRESAEFFLGHIGNFDDRVVAGRFRATCWGKAVGTPLDSGFEEGRIIQSKL